MAALNDYVLGESLYEGTETRVRRAVHRESGVRVAIKMPVATRPSARVVGCIAHEYRVLRELSAVPGVVRAHALEQHDGTVALVIDDPGFRSLDRVLAERERLPVEVALRLGSRVARALEGVHAAGLMHKDIKPANVLVDQALEQVLLEDFCIASRLTPEATAPATPEALEGTLAYISPEQTGRTARALDERTDLYSLGVVLFEMLSGRRPFLEREPLALVHAHLAKDPPTLDAIAPDVPKAVAAIVARLLAKDAERRYQTAKGVAADLEEALRRWHAQGTVQSFALGTKDFSLKLRLPQILVGRQHEIEQMGAAFAEAAAGAAELVLVGGPSGIGKTALVRTVYLDIAKKGRGLLIAGKHDQLARSTPYAALAQAFGGLIREWLASPPSVFRLWQERIRSEVGDNARLIADVVPELDLLMGKLAPVPEVQGDQVLNRQKLTWLNFVSAVTAPNAPLVMFLDDMQWADTATLLILETLLTDVERQKLLVIAAFRDNETPAEHPLWTLVTAVERSAAKVSRMTVGPLSEDQVSEWLSRTLSSDAAHVDPLARVLSHKTRGNPFFLEQSLLSLHRQGLVLRDPEGGQWRWDIAELEKAAVTDNVVTLLTDKVRQMPEPAQQILGLAACAGHAFHLQDLERLSGWERARVTAALWPALREELVVPTSGAYRPAQALAEGGTAALDASYRFLHDRVQQASYERIPPEQRTVAHLEIGRRLRAHYRTEGGTPQQLLELTRHLNLGSAQISSTEERKDLSILNLAAARGARAASAHRLMASLLDAAHALLGERSWEVEREMSVEIGLERLEAAYLLREFDDVEARALALLERPLPEVAWLSAQEIRTRCCVATGQYARGVELGMAALAKQGITFPDTEEACRAVLLQESTELDQWLERDPDGFDRMQIDQSQEHPLIDALMTQAQLCAIYGGWPMLYSLIIARIVSETIRRDALTHAATFMICSFANVWSVATGMYRRVMRWLTSGVRAAERAGSPMLPECLALKGIYTVYWSPIDEASPIYEQAIAAGLKVGSFQGTSWGLLSELLYYRVWRGMPLGQVDAQQRARWELVQRAGDAVGRRHFELVASYCEVLMSPDGAKALLEEKPLRRGSRSLLADGDRFTGGLARILEGYLFCAVGKWEWVLTRMREAEEFQADVLGMPPVTDIALFLALAAAKRWPDAATSEEQARLRQHIEHSLTRLRYFTEGCEANFLHKLRLLEAEYARVQGRIGEALEKYGEAVELAREQRFLHIEALAAQLWAELHIEAGRRHVGALYLREARDAYARWGALAVVAHLDAKYPTLLGAPLGIATAEQGTVAIGTEQLDLYSVTRASQTISGEIVLDKLARTLLEVVLEQGAAQRACLLLCQGGRVSIEAEAALDERGAATSTIGSLLVDSSPRVPESLVHYVQRTKERVILSDATSERGKLTGDDYFARHGPRSVLCMPVRRQAEVAFVLYLENNLLAGAFTPDRLAALELLATQAAISLENALLLAKERAARATAEAAERRAAFLAEAGALLSESLDYEDTLARLGRLCVHSLADYCMIDIVEGREIRRIALAHVDPAKEPLLRELARRYPPRWGSPHPAATVLRTGEPLLLPELPDEFLRTMCEDDEHLRLLRELGTRSGLVVPLMARGEMLGAFTLSSGVSGRRYGREDLELAEEVARRAATAIDNARLYRARSEFLTVASHELNTPVHSLMLAVQALRRASRPGRAVDPQALARMLELVSRQGVRLTRLTSDLLDVSRIEAGRLPLELEDVELGALVREVTQRLAADLAQSDCSVTYGGGAPVVGRWDRSRLDRVVTNLLTNAIKFGPGKPIEILVRAERGAARLVVRDHGIGVDPREIGRIFGRFERAVSEKHYGGLGLGLYISRRIVEEHGGSIRCESRPGAGATFTVDLPCATPP